MTLHSPRQLQKLVLRLSVARGFDRFDRFDDGFDGPAQGRSRDPLADPANAPRREAEQWPERPASLAPVLPRSPLRRKLPILTALALAALLVALGTVGFEVQYATRPPTVVAAPATPTPTLQPLPTVPAVVAPTPPDLAALGWVKRTLSWVELVASAPSSPNTVYACGGVAGQNSWVISFAVSQDGGHTWNTLTTSIHAAHCDAIAISPTAPQAVAIYTDSCPGACGVDAQLTFYTLDAGAHWSPVSIPCNCGNPPDDGTAIGWIGTTLFAVPATTSPPRLVNQYLAKSTNGGAFTWLTLPAQPQQLFTSGNTLYAASGTDLYTSADLGASWTKSSPTINDGSVEVVAMAPGAALVGIDARALNGVPNNFPLLRSTDGGAFWQPAPTLPDGMQTTTSVFETPDGSIYLTAVGQSAGQGGIYKLAPGASQWQLVSPVPPGNVRLAGVTWNASGQPLTLWGVAPENPGTEDPANVLYSHAA